MFFHELRGHRMEQKIEQLTGEVALYLLQRNFLPIACFALAEGFETTWRQNTVAGTAAVVRTRQGFATPVAVIADSMPARITRDGEAVRRDI